MTTARQLAIPTGRAVSYPRMAVKPELWSPSRLFTRWEIRRFAADHKAWLDARLARYWAEIVHLARHGLANDVAYLRAKLEDLEREFAVKGAVCAQPVTEFAGNLLLNEGWDNDCWELICNIGTPTNFGNANAQLVVGDNNKSATDNASATQTDLQAIAARTAWAASTAYSLGNERRRTSPTEATVVIQECTTAGTSGASEPSWNETDGATTADGSVTWTARQKKWFKAMAASYPAKGGSGMRRMDFRSADFGSTEANHEWYEFSVRNGASDATNMLRKVSNQGTKASGQTWTPTLQVTMS
jgi:hypothetical protein